MAAEVEEAADDEGAPVLFLDGYGSGDEAAGEEGQEGAAEEAFAHAEGEDVEEAQGDAALMQGLGAMLGGYGSDQEEEAEEAVAPDAVAGEDAAVEGAAGEVEGDVAEEAGAAAEMTAGITDEGVTVGHQEEEADDDYDPFADGAQQEEEEEGDGLETGKGIIILGLTSAAGQEFNGQKGTLGPFDPTSGRWQVKLADGSGTKALKPENVVLDAPAVEEAAEECDKSEDEEDDEEYQPFDDGDADIPASVWEEEEGEDAYTTWDSNEIAAAVVQAEIMGDTERAVRLNAHLKQRRAQDTKCGDAFDEGDITEEVVEVPEEAVGFVIGRAGENIQRMSSDSGARLTMARGRLDDEVKVRKCAVRGSAKQITIATKLLQEAIAEGVTPWKGKGKGKFGKGKNFAKGAGGAAGVCKWYAAGFCRNRTSDGACRNGLHCAEAGRRAEADWIAEGGPQSTPGQPAMGEPPLLLLLDLEGGGNKDGRDGEDEIIEVPVLSMCAKTGREFGRFHRFARPGYWDRENHSMRQRFPQGCFNDNSSSVPFPEVIRDMLAWIRGLQGLKESEELRPDSFLFVTCGNWDVKTAIPRQCCNPVPGMVDFAVQKLLFSRWSNLKEVFRDHYQLSQAVAPTGMKGMLRHLRIPLAGQHHLGMDDVSNLAKILRQLIKEGCSLQPTGHATNLKQPTPWGKGFGKGSTPAMQPPPSISFGCRVGKGKFAKGAADKGCGCKGFGAKGKGTGKGKDAGPGFVTGGCLGSSGADAASSSAFSKASGGPPRVEQPAQRMQPTPPRMVLPPGVRARSGPSNLMSVAGVAPQKRLASQVGGGLAKRPNGDEDLAGFLGSAPLPGQKWDGDGAPAPPPEKAAKPESAVPAPAAKAAASLLSAIPAPFDVEYDEFGDPVTGAAGAEAARAAPAEAAAAATTELFTEAAVKVAGGVAEDSAVIAEGLADEYAEAEAEAVEARLGLEEAAEAPTVGGHEEDEGEEEPEEPPAKAPRISSLLASLPAPVAGCGD